MQAVLTGGKGRILTGCRLSMSEIVASTTLRTGKVTWA